MKAALISVGRTELQLRSLGHVFVNLVKECNAAGLGLSEPHDLKVLDLIDAENNYIRTRYHYVEGFTVATVQALDGTAHELAELTVAMVRRSGVQVLAPRPALPLDYRFQVR